jgi:hypothetical protein
MNVSTEWITEEGYRRVSTTNDPAIIHAEFEQDQFLEDQPPRPNPHLIEHHGHVLRNALDALNRQYMLNHRSRI